MTDQATPAAAAEPAASNDTAADDSALIADVFGIDFDNTIAEPPGGPEGAAGEGEGTSPPSSTPAAVPAAAPAAPADGTGSATPVQPVATPDASQGGQPATPPAQPGQPAPVAVDPALRIASLEAELAEARRTGATPQPPQTEGQPSEVGFDPAKPTLIPVQLPAAVLTQIFGEDPGPEASAALNGVLSAIATGVLHRARTEYHALNTAVMARFGTQDATAQAAEQAAEAEERRNSYFGKFAHHNSPLILPILREETMKLIAELPGASWTPEFEAALGQRVDNALTAMGVQIPAPGNPTATQSPPQADPMASHGNGQGQPPKPAAMMPTGARPTPEADDDVADTFAFG